jgi:hypothetical protein
VKAGERRMTEEPSDAEMFHSAYARYVWVTSALEALEHIRLPGDKRDDPDFLKERNDWLAALEHRAQQLALLLLELDPKYQVREEKGLLKYMQLVGGIE